MEILDRPSFRTIRFYPIDETFLQNKFVEYIPWLFDKLSVLWNKQVRSIVLSEDRASAYIVVRSDVIELIESPIGQTKFEQTFRDKTVEILPIDFNQLLVTASNPESSSNIVNVLVDDCLITIMEHLSLFELCAAADVCTKFQQIAQIVYPKRFADLRFESMQRLDGPKTPYVIANMDMLHDPNCRTFQRLFHHFGQCIRSIKMNVEDTSCADILKNVAKYCSKGGVLIKLDICVYRIRNIEHQIDQALFAQVCSRLKYLQIQLTKPQIPELLLACRDLIELTIYDSSHGLPPIEERCIAFEREKLHQIVQSNQQLTKLIINARSVLAMDFSSNIFANIGFNLLELKHLEIINTFESPVDSNHLIQLANLKKLKVLKLYCKQLPMDRLMAALAVKMVPIEELWLEKFILTQSIATSLSKMCAIKKMGFFFVEADRDAWTIAASGKPELEEFVAKQSIVSRNQIVEIVRNAQKLAFIEYTTRDATITSMDYDTIVESVRQRQNGIKLNIIAVNAYYSSSVDVSTEILRRNEQWVHIDCSAVSRSTQTSYDPMYLAS